MAGGRVEASNTGWDDGCALRGRVGGTNHGRCPLGGGGAGMMEGAAPVEQPL